jgi:hypothetical protein
LLRGNEKGNDEPSTRQFVGSKRRQPTRSRRTRRACASYARPARTADVDSDAFDLPSGNAGVRTLRCIAASLRLLYRWSWGRAVAHADRPPVVMDAFDDVSVQLELGDDRGREVNPAGAEFGESDRLFTGLAQSLEQPLLLDDRERHRPIVASSELGDASSVSEKRSRVSPSS